MARGGKAGAALRDAKAQAASKLSAGSKATLAKAQAAAAKRRDHKLNAQRMASPGKLKDRWRNQGSGGGGQGQPALAGVTGGGGGGTKAIGKPGGKSGVMQTVSHGPGHTPVPHGRVAAPGGRMADYRTYKLDADVPAHYSSDPRFRSLATDPAHAGLPSDSKMRQEAMAGLEAEHQKLVPGPISRGPAEIEFYDGKGHPWDVKTPPSPKPGEKWPFRVKAIAQSIQDELTSKGTPAFPPGTYPNSITGVPEPRQIILDSSYMNTADHAALWKELNSTLQPQDLKRIVEVNTR